MEVLYRNTISNKTRYSEWAKFGKVYKANLKKISYRYRSLSPNKVVKVLDFSFHFSSIEYLRDDILKNKLVCLGDVYNSNTKGRTTDKCGGTVLSYRLKPLPKY